MNKHLPMTVKDALKAVVQESNDGYAQAYAKAALELGDSQVAEIKEDSNAVAINHQVTNKMMVGEELKVQILYILNNLSSWRGARAREVKATLKQATKIQAKGD